MAAEGFTGEQLQLLPSLDLRYRGQSFEVNVPLTGDYLTAFHAEHERLYGYRDERRPAEVVTLRQRAVGRGPRPDLTRGLCRSGEAVPEGTSPAVLDGVRLDCPLYERERLPCGGSFSGPALVVEETATHLVRPGWTARVDGRGNLLLERTTP
jgi:N-methylhydantoinase A